MANLDSDRDARQFDSIQASFEADRAGFEAVADEMSEKAAANPDARAIVWTWSWVCVVDSGGGEECTEATAEDQRLYESLPNAHRVLYLAKDPGRVYIGFNLEDPPIIHVMYDAAGGDAGAFAAERGFRSYRVLDDDWVVLGPIEDDAQYREQFPD